MTITPTTCLQLVTANGTNGVGQTRPNKLTATPACSNMAAVNSANLQTRIIAMLTAGFEERKEVFRAYVVMKGRVRNEIKVDQIHEDKATRCDRVEDW